MLQGEPQNSSAANVDKVVIYGIIITWRDSHCDTVALNTHQKVNVLCIGVAFEFETKLLAVPNSNLRLVRSGSYDRLAISCCCKAVAGLWKLEILYELDTGKDLFVLECGLAFLALVR